VQRGVARASTCMLSMICIRAHQRTRQHIFYQHATARAFEHAVLARRSLCSRRGAVSRRVERTHSDALIQKQACIVCRVHLSHRSLVLMGRVCARTALVRAVCGLHYTRRGAPSRPHATDVTLTSGPMRTVLMNEEEASEESRMPSALGDVRMCALAVRASRGRTAVEAEAKRFEVTHAHAPRVVMRSGNIIQDACVWSVDIVASWMRGAEGSAAEEWRAPMPLKSPTANQQRISVCQQ
jgi:hypothetical protein